MGRGLQSQTTGRSRAPDLLHPHSFTHYPHLLSPSFLPSVVSTPHASTLPSFPSSQYPLPQAAAADRGNAGAAAGAGATHSGTSLASDTVSSSASAKATSGSDVVVPSTGRGARASGDPGPAAAAVAAAEEGVELPEGWAGYTTDTGEVSHSK